jgi:spore cortex biosynthesis protein YabQ
MDLDLETFFTVDTQLEVFLISCGVGVVLGAIYDVLRVFRIVVPHPDLLTAIEDILYLTCYGIFLTCFAFSLMRGQIRFFFIVGNALGFALWFCTVGSILNRVAYRLKKYVLVFCSWIAYPFRKFWALCITFKKKYKKSSKTLD